MIYFVNNIVMGFNKITQEEKILTVKIEIGKNDKIIIRFPYNQELIKKIKMISGRRWNTQEKYREVPYSEDLIAKLQSLFSTKNLSAIKPA